MATTRTVEDPLGRLALRGRRPGHPRVVRPRHLRRVVARRAPRRPTARPARGADRRGALGVLLDGAVQRAGQGRHPAAGARHPGRRDFQPGTGITGIHLTVVGAVEGIDAEGFAAAAEDAKKNCPVARR